MTTTEISVVIGGLLLGYWLVSNFISRSSKNKRESNSFDNRETKTGSSSYGNSNRNTSDDSDKWFRVLGVSEHATKDEITTAYKQKIRQYHPDKVATMGPELHEIAEAKSKQINAAYDVAMKLRGQV